MVAVPTFMAFILVIMVSEDMVGHIAVVMAGAMISAQRLNTNIKVQTSHQKSTML